MERKDAIAAFGRYYQINTVNQVVEERLGRPGGNAAYFDQLEDAEKALCRAVRQDATKTINDINKQTGSIRYKLEAFLARLHMYPEGQVIRDHDRHLQERLKDAQDFLTNPKPPSYPVRMLPENIRMPAALDVGQPVYKVRAGGHGDDFDIETLHITGRQIERCMSFSGKGYDYHYAYVANGPHTQRLHFYYDRPNTARDDIDVGAGERRYFLRPEAAEKATLEVIGKLTRAFNTAIRDINGRRTARGEPGLPLFGPATEVTASKPVPKLVPGPRSDAIRLNPPS